MQSKYPISIGDMFGSWTALSTEGKMISCKCVCGITKNVNRYNLINGKSVSCGCTKDRSTPVTKHGLSKTRAYRTWKAIKARCYRKSHSDYPRYGGRGIKVCDRWKNSFQEFYNDMGERPEGASIDRIDVDGNYSPENCQWATQTQQMRNTRRSRVVIIDGTSKTVAELSETSGIPADTIYKRINAGWVGREIISKENHAARPPAKISGERR